MLLKGKYIRLIKVVLFLLSGLHVWKLDILFILYYFPWFVDLLLMELCLGQRAVNFVFKTAQKNVLITVSCIEVFNS